MKNNLKNIINEIYNLDAMGINAVVQAVKLRRNQLHSQSAGSFMKGDRVEFEGRGGRILEGTVEKVKIKYVLVHADNGQRWNVPGSHLTKIESKEVVNA